MHSSRLFYCLQIHCHTCIGAKAIQCKPKLFSVARCDPPPILRTFHFPRLTRISCNVHFSRVLQLSHPTQRPGLTDDTVQKSRQSSRPTFKPVHHKQKSNAHLGTKNCMEYPTGTVGYDSVELNGSKIKPILNSSLIFLLLTNFRSSFFLPYIFGQHLSGRTMLF